MKKISYLILMCLILSGCSNAQPESSDSEGLSLTDSTGKTVTLQKDARVASAYGSFSECWLLSGGTLVGVTDDAVNERHLSLDDNTEIIGTVKEINLEALAAINPDYVILSEDITAQKGLEQAISSMGIPYGYYRVDSFEDYDYMMKQFCTYNQREDLYQKNVTDVKNNIDNILEKVPSENNKSYLLMRAYSTGIKVKTDNIADSIIKGFHVSSLADAVPSLLDTLSLEEIIKQDPDYIFVLTMGDEAAAKKYLADSLESNPAWSELSAVKNDKLIVLPKELFHYKPNDRWDDSYEYIAKIIYPEIFE